MREWYKHGGNWSIERSKKEVMRKRNDLLLLKTDDREGDTVWPNKVDWMVRGMSLTSTVPFVGNGGRKGGRPGRLVLVVML